MPKSNGKLVKTVRFDPSLDVVFVEPSPSFGDDDGRGGGASTSGSPAAPGSAVRDHMKKYQRKHMHWPTRPSQRPPALPPRNEVVQAYAVTVEPVVPMHRPPPPPPTMSQPPQPPTRSQPPPPPPPRRKYTLSVCRERLQRFTRNRSDQSRCGDATAVAAIDVPPPAPHHRLTSQLQQAPPPPPPPAKEKDKKDAGKRKSKLLSRRKRKRNRDEEGDADDEADESDDERRGYKPGCLMSCLLFTIECMGCTIS